MFLLKVFENAYSLRPELHWLKNYIDARISNNYLVTK